LKIELLASPSKRFQRDVGRKSAQYILVLVACDLPQEVTALTGQGRRSIIELALHEFPLSLFASARGKGNPLAPQQRLASSPGVAL
jgi:hypothetical protein